VEWQITDKILMQQLYKRFLTSLQFKNILLLDVSSPDDDFINFCCSPFVASQYFDDSQSQEL